MERSDVSESAADWLMPHSGKVAVSAILVLLGTFLWVAVAYETSSVLFGGLGFLLTAWGVVISLAGFAITIVQLGRTRKAAAEVTRALTKIKRDYASFDVVTEARTALAAAEEAQGHVSGKRWPLALVSYNKMHASLSKMVAVQSGLIPKDIERTRDFIADAISAGLSIEAAASGGGEIDQPVLTGRLRELSGFLIEVEYGMKDSISV